MKPCNLFFFFLATVFPHTLHARNSTAEPSTLWTNNLSLNHNVSYTDGSMVRAILLSASFDPGSSLLPRFACGFFCTAPCNAFLFAVFIVYSSSDTINVTVAGTQVVWSANRNRPVHENATLQFTKDGDLILSDADNTVVWSTNTWGRSVRMTLTDAGNLVLVNKKNQTVWASFDHPTDSLVVGQSLREGQRLTANVSASDMTEGQFYLTVLSDGYYAYVDSSSPQLYYSYGINGTKDQSAYLTFTNEGDIELFVKNPNTPDAVIGLPVASLMQYMRLESDGHLRIYQWSNGWTMVDNLLDPLLGDCAYPTVCGAYGICSMGQCSCPRGGDQNWTYFRCNFPPHLRVLFLLVNQRKVIKEEEDDYFDHVPGMPTRFSLEELRIATENFHKKIGGGGFGYVFEGVLVDGTKIAVNRLDGFGQGKREFLAEVETIGNIHHINLVTLLGFCAEKSHRLLVYEYMCNGSLDKWIFLQNQNICLDWQIRKKIVTEITKGLSYLHEECRQKIAHLDIKPQNILLDDKFNTKVSDFGLSKLIDRDQSQVVTRMRGTRGYLAPE